MSPKKIVVKAAPSYSQEQSDPANLKFVWSYEISITNASEDIIQLLNRCWYITDMTGKIEEIHGAGVVGLQPLLTPEENFVYTSYCQLNTPQGTMEGFYTMQDLKKAHFKVDIPKFILSAPSALTKIFRSRLH